MEYKSLEETVAEMQETLKALRAKQANRVIGDDSEEDVDYIGVIEDFYDAANKIAERAVTDDIPSSVALEDEIYRILKSWNDKSSLKQEYIALAITNKVRWEHIINSNASRRGEALRILDKQSKAAYDTCVSVLVPGAQGNIAAQVVDDVMQRGLKAEIVKLRFYLGQLKKGIGVEETVNLLAEILDLNGLEEKIRLAAEDVMHYVNNRMESYSAYSRLFELENSYEGVSLVQRSVESVSEDNTSNYFYSNWEAVEKMTEDFLRSGEFIESECKFAIHRILNRDIADAALFLLEHLKEKA